MPGGGLGVALAEPRRGPPRAAGPSPGRRARAGRRRAGRARAGRAPRRRRRRGGPRAGARRAPSRRAGRRGRRARGSRRRRPAPPGGGPGARGHRSAASRSSRVPARSPPCGSLAARAGTPGGPGPGRAGRLPPHAVGGPAGAPSRLPGRSVSMPTAAAAASARSPFSRCVVPNVHAGRVVEQHPGLQLVLGSWAPDVRLEAARGDVPVDPAHVVLARPVRPTSSGSVPGPRRIPAWSPWSRPSRRRRTSRSSAGARSGSAPWRRPGSTSPSPAPHAAAGAVLAVRPAPAPLRGAAPPRARPRRPLAGVDPVGDGVEARARAGARSRRSRRRRRHRAARSRGRGAARAPARPRPGPGSPAGWRRTRRPRRGRRGRTGAARGSPRPGRPRTARPRGGRTPRSVARWSAATSSRVSTWAAVGGSTLIRCRIVSSSSVGRVVDVDLEQEPVALGLGQLVDALGLDRVLGRHGPGTARQRVGAAADADLALGHRLEQRRLHLRRRPVDLVGEHEVGEDRSELGVEGLGAGRQTRVPTMSPGMRSGVNCRRANVPPMTSARVRTASVFATPGTPSRRHVAAGEEADEHPLDHLVLADDDPLDLEQRALEGRAAPGGAGSRGGSSGWSRGRARWSLSTASWRAPRGRLRCWASMGPMAPPSGTATNVGRAHGSPGAARRPAPPATAPGRVRPRRDVEDEDGDRQGARAWSALGPVEGYRRRPRRTRPSGAA